MKLEVGKRYRTRDGKHVVEIVSRDTNPLRPSPIVGHFVADGKPTEHRARWQINGLYVRGKTRPLDLVEEAP